MDDKIIGYVSARYRKFVKDAWHDDDGYWVMLDMDHKFVGYDYGERTIHEDTLSDLKAALKIAKVVNA